LFGWRIQPESASHNSIFLSREISQLFSQTVFSSHAKSASQPASQPAEQAECFILAMWHVLITSNWVVQMYD